MIDLDEIGVDALQEALDQLDDPDPAVRLVAAIAAKNGVTQSELAEWFDVERKTVYNWLSRLDGEDLVGSVRDEDRPGRARKLDGEELAALREALRDSPSAAGLDTPAWTPRLVQRYVMAEFDVEYSIPSCRRLLKEAGLRYVPTGRDEGRTEPGQPIVSGEKGAAAGGSWRPIASSPAGSNVSDRDG